MAAMMALGRKKRRVRKKGRKKTQTLATTATPLRGSRCCGDTHSAVADANRDTCLEKYKHVFAPDLLAGQVAFVTGKQPSHWHIENLLWSAARGVHGVCPPFSGPLPSLLLCMWMLG
jgi:hypothetical protein